MNSQTTVNSQTTMAQQATALDGDTAIVVGNWLPRMVAQGLDVNDVQRVIDRVGSWNDWLPVWVEQGRTEQQLAEAAEAAGHPLTAGEAWLRAALCYHFARFVWVVDLDKNKQALALSVKAYREALRLLDPTAERIEIPFEDAALVGNLRRPEGLGPHPLVLLLPGSDSTKEEFYHWENTFLRRGLATFSLDGPGQGETWLRLPMRAEYEQAAAAALDVLLARPELDADRVAVAGVSLGGLYATRVAAFDPRVKVAVNVSGGYDLGGDRNTKKPLSLKVFDAYSWSQTPEQAQQLAARMNLRGIAEKVTQPFLVVVGGADRVRAPEQTLRTAREAPGSTLQVFEEGNHVCFNVAPIARPFIGDWVADRIG